MKILVFAIISESFQTAKIKQSHEEAMMSTEAAQQQVAERNCIEDKKIFLWVFGVAAFLFGIPLIVLVFFDIAGRYPNTIVSVVLACFSLIGFSGFMECFLHFITKIKGRLPNKRFVAYSLAILFAFRLVCLEQQTLYEFAQNGGTFYLVEEVSQGGLLPNTLVRVTFEVIPKPLESAIEEVGNFRVRVMMTEGDTVFSETFAALPAKRKIETAFGTYAFRVCLNNYFFDAPLKTFPKPEWILLGIHYRSGMLLGMALRFFDLSYWPTHGWLYQNQGCAY